VRRGAAPSGMGKGNQQVLFTHAENKLDSGPGRLTQFAGKRVRRAAAVVASLGVVSLATIIPATVASAAPPPPAKGLTPAVSETSTGVANLFYTATDGTVWTKTVNGTPGTATQVSNGKITTGPAAIVAGTTQVVFGVTSGGALWTATQSGGKWGNWTSLGGILTSQPGAAFEGPNAADYAVFARGTNGAVWARDHTSAGWGAWHSDGGNLLAGTGPAAAANNGVYLLVVGTNKQTYIAKAGLTGFSAAGGLTTATPGLASIPGSVVGFVRGTNNVAYYHKFLSTTPGWHSAGGVFGSGLGAAAAGTGTYTVGAASGGNVYRSTGSWATYPPKLSGWTNVTG
jgi:hypothetical protein